jgi:hypothetical protein
VVLAWRLTQPFLKSALIFVICGFLLNLLQKGARYFWSLWACNREEKPQGVYSHQTALAIFELSDINPSKLHMTVPRTFRRSSEIPPHLVLHDGELGKDAIEEREGYRLTTPLQTIHDVCHEASISRDLVKQAISEAVIKGLISQREKKAEQNSSELPEWARRIFNDLE